MELKYTLTNRTGRGYIVSYLIVRDNTIIDSTKDMFEIAMGKSPDLFLQQLYIWGLDIKIEIKIIGLSYLANLLFIFEEEFEKILKKYDKTIPVYERMYVKLLYPDGHFGYIEYDGTSEDRFRIIKEHTDLFGRADRITRNVEVNLNIATAGNLKRIIPKNNFEFKL